MINRILIIDDDPFIVKTLISILNSIKKNDPQDKTNTYQYSIEVATNGMQGIQAVKQSVTSYQPFSLAYIDLLMPEMSGSETIKHIWQIDPLIKIVVITADSKIPTTTILDLVNREDIFYLRKPFAADEIIQYARALCKQWRLEKELINHKNNLQEMVDHQTQELQKLYNYVKEMDEDKERFINYLSHEFNTPLNFMTGMDFLNQTRLSLLENQMLSCAIEGRNQLVKLVQAFVSYYTFQKNVLDKGLTQMDMQLKPILLNIIQETKEKYQNCQLSIKTCDDFDSIGIHADPYYFEMFTRIIIENAFYFSQPEGIMNLSIDHDASGLCWQINNLGQGIDTQYLDKIFIPFMIPSHLRNKHGFGLNLPKARLIAQQHGWKLWAESKGLDSGASFFILMPKIQVSLED